jgi:hypothetical protein
MSTDAGGETFYLHRDGWLYNYKPVGDDQPKDPKQFVFPVKDAMELPNRRGRVQYYRFEGFDLPKFNHGLKTADSKEKLAWPGALNFMMKLGWIQSKFAEIERPKKPLSSCTVCLGKSEEYDKSPHACHGVLPCEYCPGGNSAFAIANCQYAFGKYSWQHTYLHRIGDHSMIPSREFYEFIRNVDPKQILDDAKKAVKEQMVPMSDELMARVTAVRAGLNPNQTVAGGGVQKQLPRIVMPPARYAGWNNDESRAIATSDDFVKKCKDTAWLAQRMKDPSKEMTQAVNDLKSEGLKNLMIVAREAKMAARHKRMKQTLKQRITDGEAAAEEKAKEIQKKIASTTSAEPLLPPASRPYTKLEMLAELTSSSSSGST